MSHCARPGCRQTAGWLVQAQGPWGSYAAHACHRHRGGINRQAAKFGTPRETELADAPAEPPEAQLELFT